MKMKFWSLFAMLCLAMPAFVSCGDDDDKDDPTPSDILNVIGNYTGSLNAVVNIPTAGSINIPLEGDFQVGIVSQKGDNDEVTVILPKCTYTPAGTTQSFTIPSLSVRDVDVDRDPASSGYILSEDDFSLMIDGTRYTGIIYGTISGNNANLSYAITPGNMGMPINFSFAGKK